ncbi:hypothetical protein U472_10725 [Orenia metallireducens]|jgi:fluoroquinolone transport system permease protein|uniref:Fluoroquinolone transport system permease protein n=1 Tax=Orenia metallireducens TaxID=1413210 RepID=A0A1C0A876_9FIRM|nr:hypothetical protein [Orenia metallireducens]OCL26463.1 hypothetical protein U472_10725 [Orenia metallireducens]
MRRLLANIKGDIFLQFKYGFYGVYAILVLFYILTLRFLAVKISAFLLPIIIFSDPSLLGFYFIGGLILLEKDENTLDCLVATPLRIREYLISKMVSLTILGLLASMIIVLFSYGTEFNYLLLISGIVLTSCFFVLIGFVAVARFNTINDYIFSSIIYMMILNYPLFEYFGLYQSFLSYFSPTQASLLLISGAFSGIEFWQTIYGIAYLIIAIIIVYHFAYKSFYKFIILKGGKR